MVFGTLISEAFWRIHVSDGRGIKAQFVMNYFEMGLKKLIITVTQLLQETNHGVAFIGTNVTQKNRRIMCYVCTRVSIIQLIDNFFYW